VTGTLPDLAPDLRAILERHADRLDLDLIERALRFSASAHRGQKRMSGEDFVSHSIAVALILAEQLLDSTTIAAALLHDVVEDSDVRTEDIAKEFGGEIAGIVDGLTKISSLTFRSSAEEQVENYRKLLLSIARTPASSSSSWATGCTTCARWSTCRPSGGAASPSRPGRSTHRWRTGSAWQA
jgi:GTP pyrophosphokinase